ncbi:nucleoside hydrolase [Leptolyngbya sp. FACHB-261]|uniref:nucleoside hydrolase n=1 Tax=Leptolyngbya sp. FACHB-261 TaxID=2692806 RepID=UPI0016840DD9|nr:nucleoside hydrolase [Leptolyngbya sp. FACHB-261]MBD2101393.1 nucleoside hydrolase [Leptolyngbya sp. FACHB-261]
MSARPLLIDCDPGQDDAVALLLALASPAELNVLGVTTVAGNVPLALTQKNARKVCELAGRADVPVYAGCPRPLLRPLATAEYVHGPSGLDGVDLPEPTLPLQAQHGVDFLIDSLMTASTSLTVATLGPPTNLAVAIVKEPRILSQIGEVVLMGGAIGEGNVTASAEFNIYVDPHAAQIVFSSGVKLTMIGLDVTHRVITTPERLAAIRGLGTRVGGVTADLLTYYGTYDIERYSLPGGPLHDPCVIAYLLQPDLFKSRPLYVEIETHSELTLGRTVVDLWNSSQREPNVNVVQAVDAEGFYTLLTERLARL